MNDPGSDAATRLWWAVKRYRLLVAAVVVVMAALGAIVGPSLMADEDGPVYEATALVVAAQLEVRPELLPKTAVSIFEAGAVAAGTAERLGLESGDDLVPDVIDVDPVESSVVLEVNARSADAATAAVLANVAAEAFVEELNRPGELFGRFIVQERATPPPRPEPQPGPVLPLAIGVFAGLAFALGLVGLYVALRRPVLTPVEVAELTDAPVLGAPNLPRGRSYDPTQVPGLTALLKRIFPRREETTVVVGVRGDRGERTSVAMLLARGLARTGTVQLVTEVELSDELSADERRNIVAATMLEVDQRRDPIPAVIDGPTAEGMDVPQFLPGDAHVVLVVREGTSSRALEAATSQFLPGELYGVLFVPVTRRSARVVVGTTAARGVPGADVSRVAPGDDVARSRRARLSGPFAQVAKDFEPLPSSSRPWTDEPDEPDVYRASTASGDGQGDLASATAPPRAPGDPLAELAQDLSRIVEESEADAPAPPEPAADVADDARS